MWSWLVDGELCTYRKRDFAIHGCLDIPIVDTDDVFTWGVWVSLSRENAKRAIDVWFTDGRESEEAYFGWVLTALPYEPSTVLLKANIHTRPIGERPFIELESTDHPLAVEQREGVTRNRAIEIATAVLHG